LDFEWEDEKKEMLDMGSEMELRNLVAAIFVFHLKIEPIAFVPRRALVAPEG